MFFAGLTYNRLFIWHAKNKLFSFLKNENLYFFLDSIKKEITNNLNNNLNKIRALDSRGYSTDFLQIKLNNSKNIKI